MATINTYQPYIELSYNILSTLEDLKNIKQEKDDTLKNLNNYKQLISEKRHILNEFPRVKKDVYSQFSFLDIDKDAQFLFKNNCQNLEQILTIIDNCKKHISFLEANNKTESTQKISDAEKAINTILTNTEFKQIGASLQVIQNQNNLLENAFKEYNEKQERIRLQKEDEERRKQEEERRRRELEEQAKLDAEQKRQENIKLWTNIAKWAGIIIGAVLLLIFVVIPIIQFIIENIVVILIVLGVIGFIIYKVRSK